MGNRLFGVDISGLIKQFVGPGVLDAVLTKITIAARTVGQLTGGTNSTETDYPCKGFIDTQRRETIEAATLTDAGTRKIALIGDTIANGTVYPVAGDKITIEGIVYIIPEDGRIERDPAKALYICTVREL